MSTMTEYINLKPGTLCRQHTGIVASFSLGIILCHNIPYDEAIRYFGYL